MTIRNKPSADVLRNQYVEQRMHPNELATQYGCCKYTIYDWLNKYNIDRTKQSDIPLVLQPETVEVFNGWLLKHLSIPCAGYGRSHRVLIYHSARELVDYIQRSTQQDIWGVSPHMDNYNCSMFHHQHRVQTLTNVTFANMYAKWHNKQGERRIPNDLRLTPRCMLIWYLFAGRLASTKDYSPVVLLSNNDYGVRNINKVLIPQLQQWNPIIQHKKNGGCNIIIQNQQDVRAFFDHIGACPLPCFKYKFV